MNIMVGSKLFITFGAKPMHQFMRSKHKITDDFLSSVDTVSRAKRNHLHLSLETIINIYLSRRKRL